ncbi:MAG: GatB/YqeY domain-containing protein [Actinomycetota bacterium]
MSLKEKISEDMKASLKGGEKERLSTLRMLISAIKYTEIEKRQELKNEDVLEVISREIKRRREAVEEYRKGNRPDLVEKEEREAKILEEYLPPQLSDAEIEAIVKEVIDETGAMGPRDIGKVMGLVMPRVKGRADGRKVNDIVGRLLTT